LFAVEVPEVIKNGAIRVSLGFALGQPLPEVTQAEVGAALRTGLLVCSGQHLVDIVAAQLDLVVAAIMGKLLKITVATAQKVLFERAGEASG